MDYSPGHGNNTTGQSLDFGGDLKDLEVFGPELQAFLCTVYSLTALASLMGNSTVIFVLVKGKRSSRELRIFLINLSVSDVSMSLFSIPFTYTNVMLGRWIFEPAFCPIVQFIQHCSVIVSVYTLTAVGLDRYYAILYPLSSRWTKSRSVVTLLLVWTLAIGISCVQLLNSEAKRLEHYGLEYYDCLEEWGELDGKVYSGVIFAATFVVPLMVLIFSYSSIGWRLWNHTSPGNEDLNRDRQLLKSKLKVVKMLATVMFLFVVCWFPIQIFNLLCYFDSEFTIVTSKVEYYTFYGIFFLCHWMSMANSFVNPIIYCLMSDTFKMDLQQVCGRTRWRTSKSERTLVSRGSNSSSFGTSTRVSFSPVRSSQSIKGGRTSLKRILPNANHDRKQSNGTDV